MKTNAMVAQSDKDDEKAFTCVEVEANQIQEKFKEESYRRFDQ